MVSLRGAGLALGAVRMGIIMAWDSRPAVLASKLVFSSSWVLTASSPLSLYLVLYPLSFSCCWHPVGRVVFAVRFFFLFGWGLGKEAMAIGRSSGCIFIMRE